MLLVLLLLLMDVIAIIAAAIIADIIIKFGCCVAILKTDVIDYPIIIP